MWERERERERERESSDYCILEEAEEKGPIMNLINTWDKHEYIFFPSRRSLWCPLYHTSDVLRTTSYSLRCEHKFNEIHGFLIVICPFPVPPHI